MNKPGWQDDDSDEPEAQLIWLLLREEARDESQSLRDDFKMQMKSLKDRAFLWSDGYLIVFYSIL